MNDFEKVNKLLGREDYQSDNEIDWYVISFHQRLLENSIREFQDNVDWFNISIYQKLSENFIREFKNKVNWCNISAYQKLSECFIREFQDRVDWIIISKYQKLSEGFIEEFKDKVDWFNISRHQKLSYNFISKFTNRLNLALISDSWLYWDTKKKKQKVMETKLYECHKDYFIAYKGIKSDRYSKFNFQYKYEPGKIYESWCDCSSERNSFGLSVWTKNRAREYSNELVVKVKIRYEDVGRVTDWGKVRCFRIEVLE